MPTRRLLLAAFLTVCLSVLACWILSVREPVAPARNVPRVPALFDGSQAMHQLDLLTHRFKGRVAGSAQGFAAANYIAGQFRAYGLKVEVQDFREVGYMFDRAQWGWYPGQNVIGILQGQAKGAVVLTAHRDCVAKAPEGAYDNGSGTAVLLELARVLAAGEPHRYTYVFIATDGEELGMSGSRALMNKRPSALQDIRLMINMDMLGIKGNPQLGVSHTQFLPPETRALVATSLHIPKYNLLQFPMGRGTDAQIYVLRGLPTLDIREFLQAFTKAETHNARDTYDRISTDSIQKAGRTVEQLIREGDAMGVFVPSEGVVASNQSGILLPWRYRLGGACIFLALVLPLLFHLRPINGGYRPVKVMAVLILFVGVLTYLSAFWSGSLIFAALPFWGIIAFVVLQIVVICRAKGEDDGLGRLLVSAAPSLLFAGTWGLTGLWPLGFVLAVLAYFPAVLVTWKTGWRWRLFDIALTMPMFLLTFPIALIACLSAPLRFFPPAKLPFFAALYFAITLIGIWGIFGHRPRPAVALEPAQNAIRE
jgi:hypothetical protein